MYSYYLYIKGEDDEFLADAEQNLAIFQEYEFMSQTEDGDEFCTTENKTITELPWFGDFNPSFSEGDLKVNPDLKMKVRAFYTQVEEPLPSLKDLVYDDLLDESSWAYCLTSHDWDEDEVWNRETFYEMTPKEDDLIRDEDGEVEDWKHRHLYKTEIPEEDGIHVTEHIDIYGPEEDGYSEEEKSYVVEY